ncbi:MAG: serine/threonine protein kinase [Planctomycetaceae bacterium]
MASRETDIDPRDAQTPVGTEEATLVMTTEQLRQAEQLSRTQHQPPSQVRGYQILRCLGEGAYGAVWLARETNTGKLVAIKFYTHRRSLDWSLLNREVEKLATLYTSRKIVGLVEVGWDGDPPYYVMEFLENGSLANVLATGPLPVGEAVRIARSVIVALVHAHGRGVLHCDLKPANVLLDADFEPRLCDFGQSRLSHEQNPALGTLFYMAPEQSDLQAIPDARWDVYALGALLYHMLCGEPPHRTEEHLQRIHSAHTLEERLAEYQRILKQSPQPLAHRKVKGVDRRLADIIERCLQVDPQKRFPNAQAVLDALDEREKFRQRRPLIVLGIVGPAVLLITMAVVAFQMLSRTVQESESNLISSALESDEIAVHFMAHSVERELETRKTELEEIAANKELIAAVTASAQTEFRDRAHVQELLNFHKNRIDVRSDEQGREQAVSWFFVDRQGIQRWRHPLKGDSLDKLWNHRDYYHGLNRAFPEGQVPADIKPIQKPHISITFRSSVTNKYMVAISVPVWNGEKTEVIGVLAQTTHLGQLLESHSRSIGGEKADVSDKPVNRIISLVDGRDGKLLDHPWMTEDHMNDLSAIQTEQMKWSPEQINEYSEHILTHSEDRKLAAGKHEDDHMARLLNDDAYFDPVGQLSPAEYGGEWLAAFAPVGNLEWIAVVQERRKSALQPIQQMRSNTIRFGIGAIVVGGALVGILWYFVLRALREREERIWSRHLLSTGHVGMKTPTDF